MPSGHTDRVTVNSRRPLTPLMVAMLRLYLTVAEPPRMRGADRSVQRALLDRGCLAPRTPLPGCYVTRSGFAALKQHNAKAGR